MDGWWDNGWTDPSQYLTFKVLDPLEPMQIIHRIALKEKSKHSGVSEDTHQYLDVFSVELHHHYIFSPLHLEFNSASGF